MIGSVDASSEGVFWRCSMTNTDCKVGRIAWNMVVQGRRWWHEESVHGQNSCKTSQAPICIIRHFVICIC
jgi:hypothetical protein